MLKITFKNKDSHKREEPERKVLQDKKNKKIIELAIRKKREGEKPQKHHSMDSNYAISIEDPHSHTYKVRLPNDACQDDRCKSVLIK